MVGRLDAAALQRAGERAQDRVALIVVNVIATSPRSSVGAGDRSSGRLPRYVYGFVLSTIVK